MLNQSLCPVRLLSPKGFTNNIDHISKCSICWQAWCNAGSHQTACLRAPFWSPLHCRMVEDAQSLSAVQCQVCFLCNLQFIESILPVTQRWSPNAHASRTLLTVCISVSNCLSYVCTVRKPQISGHCILSMSLLLIYPNCKIRWSKCNSRLSRSALHATLHY